MDFHGSVTAHVDATPADVFALITDIDRLPEWNAGIHHVVERPEALTEGAEWVVEIRALRTNWNSRSQLVELDDNALRFVYRSQSDDGDPSFAIWTWELAPSDGGTTVVVRWVGSPKTFWRKVLLSEIRRRQLANEVRASIARTAAVVERKSS